MEPDKIISNEKGEKDFKSPYKLNFWHIFTIARSPKEQ